MDILAPRLAAAALAVGLVFASQVTGAAAPSGRYTLASGTVYDTKTKLTWQQPPSPTLYQWPAAATYCSGLTLNGGGWRLPSMKELVTIVDSSVAFPGPTIDANAFPGTSTGAAFWSSTPAVSMSGYAWVVDFAGGSTGFYAQTFSNAVRCVR